MGAARAGVLPSRPPGRRARRVPASPGDPGRRARHRPLTRAPPAPRTHPATEPGARDQRLAAPRVPAPRAHRLRQLRRRLARAPARGGQGRGGQGDPSALGERSRLHPQVRDRGADRRSPRAPARGPALRLLARTRRGVPRHAIPPGREPRPGDRFRSARARTGREAARPGGRRARGGRPPRRRPPRREAEQHPARRGGQRVPRRLRDREGHDRARRDGARDSQGDARLSRAGADPPGNGHAADRLVCARRGAVRGARRRAPVPRRARHDGARPPPARTAPLGPRTPARTVARRGRGHRDRDGEGSRSPLPRRARDGRRVPRCDHAGARRRGADWSTHQGPQPVQGTSPVHGGGRERLLRTRGVRRTAAGAVAQSVRRSAVAVPRRRRTERERQVLRRSSGPRARTSSRRGRRLGRLVHHRDGPGSPSDGGARGRAPSGGRAVATGPARPARVWAPRPDRRRRPDHARGIGARPPRRPVRGGVHADGVREPNGRCCSRASGWPSPTRRAASG